MGKRHKIIIVGSGPSGLTAAIYAARAGLQPLIFEGAQPGGQLTTTTEIENYPGFPEGISGPELMDKMREQALRFGAESLFRTVTEVDLSQKPFRIRDDEEESYEAETLIISTGASAKYLGLESESRLKGYGVSACATCDGFFYKDKDIVVVGGGDTALEEALYLTHFGKTVTIIHRRDEFRASKFMAKKALNNPKIRIKWDSVVEEVLGESGPTGVTGVRIRNVKTGKKEDLPCSGFFVAIGHHPNTELFSDYLEQDEIGYIITKGKSTQTSIPGVFACGDVQDPVYRQAVSAAGSGCMAAMDAERWLSEQEP
ncbi:MAG: thioredoxin-disulfide reductase [Candidatus Neomarinimicrobiota bacterium]|jgi:thioredoxin reductase (NADPH)|nr:thioredoxin-disulfide reductase [Candidatus Neomarinimicrobiota bacterium]MDD3965834.1 thioredoxin-disulfide reductase [Candidatus Neomarinimicrobiota bacterium]MDX9779707.1 thioredoxin-disulfide reductase [bacterium]